MTSWKITTFNRKYVFNPGPFSIAMLVYQSDSHTPTRYQNLPLRKKSHSLTSPMFPSFSCKKKIWKNDPAQKREASKGCCFCMALLCFVCIPSEQRLITQRSHEPWIPDWLRFNPRHLTAVWWFFAPPCKKNFLRDVWRSPVQQNRPKKITNNSQLYKGPRWVENFIPLKNPSKSLQHHESGEKKTYPS